MVPLVAARAERQRESLLHLGLIAVLWAIPLRMHQLTT